MNHEVLGPFDSHHQTGQPKGEQNRLPGTAIGQTSKGRHPGIDMASLHRMVHCHYYAPDLSD
jgi:hypothetical protein